MLNKKIFFSILFMLLVFVFISSEAQQSSFPVHIILLGKVQEHGGKGIAGVAVTDGINVVRTDRKGAYILESTNEAAFVYISLPSGYEVPTNGGIAEFYRKIESHHGVFKADFYLKKMARSDLRHYTILWADPQINNMEQAGQLHSTAVPDAKILATELLKSGPVLGIAAGDIAWDAAPIIPEYKKAVKETGIPFFQVLGNHDMNVNVRSDECSDSSFSENFGPSWYSFNRGEAHYVILDNVFYYSNGYNYIGYLTERQLKWLEQDLASVKPGSLVFVSMHISGYTEEKRRNRLKTDNPGNVTFNRRFLFDMLKPFKAHLLTGHTHYNENRTEAGVYEHIHGAVCAAWWTIPICDDGTPAGYGVYEVNGTNVKWYYKSIGFGREYQMRTYNRGAYPKKPADIAVNVWNWDKEWKVVWYEDGILKGPMRQEVDFDADAVRLMSGGGKPEKYSWIEPRLTDHLFFATPDASARKVSVEATDRFGSKYKEEILLK